MVALYKEDEKICVVGAKVDGLWKTERDGKDGRIDVATKKIRNKEDSSLAAKMNSKVVITPQMCARYFNFSTKPWDKTTNPQQYLLGVGGSEYKKASYLELMLTNPLGSISTSNTKMSSSVRGAELLLAD